MSRPEIQHYSDVLCVWAYVSHIRLDELLRRHEDEIDVDMLFCPVFPDALGKIGQNWKNRGGFAAYARHVAEVCQRFDHVTLHERCWCDVKPVSSTAAHLFLKAVMVAENARLDRDGAPAPKLRDSAYYRATWALRRAFFAEGRDICDWQVQAAVAEELKLDLAPIEAALKNGRAVAALDADTRSCEQNRISGSPTFRMNAGRQILYGNVGYSLIEANVSELLREPDADRASWC